MRKFKTMRIWKKGQLFVADLTVWTIVMLLILTLLSSVWLDAYHRTQERTDKNIMSKSLVYASELLVSEGSPVSIVRGGKLDTDKMDIFIKRCREDYEVTREMLGLYHSGCNLDYGVVVYYLNGTVIGSCNADLNNGLVYNRYITDDTGNVVVVSLKVNKA